MGRHLARIAMATVAVLTAPTAALAQHAPGAALVRAMGIGGGMPMSDLDGYIQDNLDARLTPSAGRNTLDELGWSGGGGGEVGYMVSPRWSAGLAVTHGTGSASAVFGALLFPAFGGNSLDASITDVTASATFWPARARGLCAGVESGVGFGRLEEDFNYGDSNGNSLDYHGTWHGTGFVAGAFAGYERRFRWGFDGLARVGYKYRNLGVMPGHRTVTSSTYSAYPTGTTSGPIRDSSGRALESDFSLFYLGIGLGRSWGTR
jgi:hypothetical protein